MKKLLLSLALIFGLTGIAHASLYDFYAGKLPSLPDRAKIAQNYGISDYTGTYSQNIVLEKKLRENANLGLTPTPQPLLNGTNVWTGKNTFNGGATSTRMIVGTNNPTAAASTTAGLWVGGNATTTASMDVNTLCFNGVNCVDSVKNLLVVTSTPDDTIRQHVADNEVDICSATVPANYMTSRMINIHAAVHGEGLSGPLVFKMYYGSTQISTVSAPAGEVGIELNGFIYGTSTNNQAGVLTLNSAKNSSVWDNSILSNRGLAQINSGAAQTVRLTGQVSTGSDTWYKSGCHIELVY